MGEILVICALYTIPEAWSALLDGGRVLGSQMSRGGVEYVAIPDHSFFELAAQHSNIVIFDTCMPIVEPADGPSSFPVGFQFPQLT